MIQGVVNAAHQPVITLEFRGPLGRSPHIEAIVDTGFTEFLMLPPGLVTELGFPFAGTASATLADGVDAEFDVHRGMVLWDGYPRHVGIYLSDTKPLVGMRLMDRHSLYIEVERGGRVVVQAAA